MTPLEFILSLMCIASAAGLTLYGIISSRRISKPLREAIERSREDVRAGRVVSMDEADEQIRC